MCSSTTPLPFPTSIALQDGGAIGSVDSFVKYSDLVAGDFTKIIPFTTTNRTTNVAVTLEYDSLVTAFSITLVTYPNNQVGTVVAPGILRGMPTKAGQNMVYQTLATSIFN